MPKPRIDILECDIEGGKWLQVSAIRRSVCVGTATVHWISIEGKAPELCNLFVQESARRTGVAQAIIEAVRRYYPRPLCLHVVQDSPAYWLYRKLGFLEVGAVKEKENNVWMQDYNH